MTTMQFVILALLQLHVNCDILRFSAVQPNSTSDAIEDLLDWMLVGNLNITLATASRNQVPGVTARAPSARAGQPSTPAATITTAISRWTASQHGDHHHFRLRYHVRYQLLHSLRLHHFGLNLQLLRARAPSLVFTTMSLAPRRNVVERQAVF